MICAGEPKTCLGFFAGSGVASFALADFFTAAWTNDICAKKAKVFNANHAEHPLALGSMENVSGAELPAPALSWGSFSSQDWSLAGNMNGLYGLLQSSH